LNASSFYIDAALGLAALAAIGTVSLARYIANKKVS
jgi:multisubunit Na+/H+ antiporter MnhF subunit